MTGDWPQCIHLATHTTVSIDYERSSDCMTPLILAAEENVEATDYVYRRNEDGKRGFAKKGRGLNKKKFYHPSLVLK